MKPVSFIAVLAGLLLIISLTPIYGAEANKKRITPVVERSTPPASNQKKLQATRKMLIERMRASRQQLNDSLPLYEEKLANQTADFETKKKLYEQDLIARRDFENSQQVMTNTRLETERIRQLIAEDDVALSLTEEVAEEEMARLPKLALGAYDETPTLIRYNGPANWSTADTGKIARFYRTHFGHRLPVSAMGQSLTHDRMGFDHRDAVDVAVSPDSAEGRGLMAYLRKARIPFLAFRGKVPGMSTGAHIHIGRPSPRLMEVRQRSIQPAPLERSTEGG